LQGFANQSAESKQSDFQDLADFSDWFARYRQRCDREALSPGERAAQMRAVNPKYILHNYIAEEAIRVVEEGDFEPENQILGLLRRPFGEHPEFRRYAEAALDWAGQISLGCSS